MLLCLTKLGLVVPLLLSSLHNAEGQEVVTPVTHSGLRHGRPEVTNVVPTDKRQLALTSNCFSGMNTVEVHNKGLVAMKDLKVGDFVKSTDGKMVLVYGFGPYQPRIKAEFLQIFAKNIPQPLEISKGHMVFVNGEAVPASAVQVGDKLDTATGQGTADVLKIEKVTRTGIYTPFTTSGTIMVNGVVASSYVTAQEGSKALVLRGHPLPLSMQWLAHMFHALPRMACMMRARYCTSSQDALSEWVAGTLLVEKWLQEQTWTIAIAAFVPLLVMGLLTYFVEAALLGNVMVLALVGAVLARGGHA